MGPRRKGGIRLGIKFGGLLLLSLAVLFALGAVLGFENCLTRTMLR